MPVLQLRLPENVLYQKVTIFEQLDPQMWTATNLLGTEHCLSEPENAKLFFADVESSLKTKIDNVFVSIRQDADGRHCFVSLGSVASALKARSGELPICSEAEVKAQRDGGGAVMLFAKPVDVLEVCNVAPKQSFTGDADNLCPKLSRFLNYDVIPDLSLGASQKLILCDEATLMRTLPDERIFEYLTLIVNCHENAVSPDKYQVGACTMGKHPAVICQAVHGWHSRDNSGMNKKNDEIQIAMWEHLQHGTVAVHCLAGIHRAACIVACHFLWRHYALGHKHIPADPVEIYRRLQAARPAVDPAYEHVLRSYEAHLKATSRQ